MKDSMRKTTMIAVINGNCDKEKEGANVPAL